MVFLADGHLPVTPGQIKGSDKLHFTSWSIRSSMRDIGYRVEAAIIHAHAEGRVFLLDQYDWRGPFAGGSFDYPVLLHLLELFTYCVAVGVWNPVRR